MSNKTRGLGRGLGDLLADNAPEIRSSSVIRRDENGEVSISPIAESGEPISRKSPNDEIADESSRPLVFPKVTPIVGGSGQADEDDTPIDEAREILEADAAISGKPFDEALTVSCSDRLDRGENSEAGNTEERVVYPRSLKAVFRNFK